MELVILMCDYGTKNIFTFPGLNPVLTHGMPTLYPTRRDLCGRINSGSPVASLLSILNFMKKIMASLYPSPSLKLQLLKMLKLGPSN